MSIIHVTFTPTRNSQRENPEPFDMDTWTVEGLEFSIQNNYQSRHYRTRHVLHFSGSDNAHNYQNPERPWENITQQRPGAFLSPQAICLTATPQEKLPTMDAEMGDVFVGEIPSGPVMLRMVPGGRHSDPKVEVLYCPPATMDHTKWITELEARRASR